MNEADIRRAGLKALVGKLPMSRVARAVEKGESRGFLKIYVEESSARILGASLLGTGADESVQSLIDAVYARTTYTEFQRHVRIHPTVSELLPTMCAGITTYNALRNSGAKPGELVAILGLGGLGHLGVQYAARMGFKTVAIVRGTEKGPLSRELGAAEYIDSRSQDPAEALRRLGGAKLVLATVTSGKAMAQTFGGLGVDGKLLIVGATADTVEVPPLQLIGGRRSIAGWPSGRSIDTEEALAFSSLTGVRSMNEIYPLERAPEAYDRMMSGKARFRVVLTTG